MSRNEFDESILASDQEREAVIGVLSAATSAGRLTLEEFSDRVGQVYLARQRRQLRELLADLPTPVRFTDDTAVVVPVRHRIAPPARAEHLLPVGAVKRSGWWRLDQHVELGTALGTVKLDLRGAVMDAPEVTLVVPLDS